MFEMSLSEKMNYRSPGDPKASGSGKQYKLMSSPPNFYSVKRIFDTLRGGEFLYYYDLFAEDSPIMDAPIPGIGTPIIQFNQKGGSVYPYKNAMRVGVTIGTESIMYHLYISYFGMESESSVEKKAMVINTPEYDNLVRILEYIGKGSVGKLTDPDSPLSLINRRFTEAMNTKKAEVLAFLYHSAPLEILKERSPELLFADLTLLATVNKKSWLTDTSAGMLCALMALKPGDALMKFKKEPGYLWNVYDAFGDNVTSKGEFCEYLRMLSLYFRKNCTKKTEEGLLKKPLVQNDQDNYSYYTKKEPDNSINLIITKKVLYKPTSQSKKDSSSDDNNNVIQSPRGETLFDKDDKPFIPTILDNDTYHPMDLCTYDFYLKSEDKGKYPIETPIIYLYYMRENRIYEENKWANAVFLSMVGLFMSFASILEASWLLSLLDISLFSGELYYLALTSEESKYLEQIEGPEKPHAKWFVQNWGVISRALIAGSLSTATYDTIVEYGPKLREFLLNAKKIDLAAKLKVMMEVATKVMKGDGKGLLTETISTEEILCNIIGVTKPNSMVKALQEYGISVAQTEKELSIWYKGEEIFKGNKGEVLKELENIYNKSTPNRIAYLDNLLKEIDINAKVANRYSKLYIRPESLFKLLTREEVRSIYGSYAINLVENVERQVSILIKKAAGSGNTLGRSVLSSGLAHERLGIMSEVFTNFTREEIEDGAVAKFLENMHPTTRKRLIRHLVEREHGLNVVDKDVLKFGWKDFAEGKVIPHAEFRALDDLLKKISKKTGLAEVPESIIYETIGYNRYLRKSGIQGECADCFYLLDGVTFIKPPIK